MAALLAQGGATASMSRWGSCYDNAMMESFWATLKTECFAGQRPATRQAARLRIFDYIEGFYNRRRLHSGIGYQSPAGVRANVRLQPKLTLTKTTEASSTFSKKDHSLPHAQLHRTLLQQA